MLQRIEKIPQILVDWPKTYRVVLDIYPEIREFGRVVQQEEEDALHAYINAYDPVIRDNLFLPEDSVYGTNASFVMRPFYYKTPAGRFNNENFGGYYGTKEFKTAMYEKIFHMNKFYLDSNQEEGILENWLVLKGSISSELHDVRKITNSKQIHNPDSYENSQKLAQALWQNNSNGILYNSVIPFLRLKETNAF